MMNKMYEYMHINLEIIGMLSVFDIFIPTPEELNAFIHKELISQHIWDPNLDDFS